MFGFHGFCLKIFKIIQLNSNRFLKKRAEENLVVNNKDNRVFMSQNYQSDSCPLEILCSLWVTVALQKLFVSD